MWTLLSTRHTNRLNIITYNNRTLLWLLRTYIILYYTLCFYSLSLLLHCIVKYQCITKKPEVLSNRHRKRMVKLRCNRRLLSGCKASCSVMDGDGDPGSVGMAEFHMSCLCNSSRSSECTSSQTDWCTMSDCKIKQDDNVL